MRRYLVSIIFLILVIWAGVKLQTHTAYLLIASRHWAVQMPLWLAILLFFAAFFVLYGLVRLSKYTGTLGERWRQWHGERRKTKAIKLTNQGLIELAEGNFQKAETLLVHSADDSDEPLLNYLAAALAAQGQKAYDRRAEYLHKAHDVEPAADMAIGLTQAQLQINHRQYEQALATLNRLHEINPKQHYVLRLMKNLFIKLQQWSEVEKLLPSLKKYADYPEAKYNELAINVYQHLFAELTDVAQLETIWHDLPSYLQQQPQVSLAYVKRLLALGEDELAETVIRKILKKHWISELAGLYGKADVDVKQQLANATEWLAAHPHDAELLRSLGTLAARNNLFDKAYEYYQASIAIKPTGQTYFLLAKLCEQQSKTDESLKYYHAGMTMLLAAV